MASLSPPSLCPATLAFLLLLLKVKVAQLCLTLYDPMDYRVLEMVAFPSSFLLELLNMPSNLVRSRLCSLQSECFCIHLHVFAICVSVWGCTRMCECTHAHSLFPI